MYLHLPINSKLRNDMIFPLELSEICTFLKKYTPHYVFKNAAFELELGVHELGVLNLSLQ